MSSVRGYLGNQKFIYQPLSQKISAANRLMTSLTATAETTRVKQCLPVDYIYFTIVYKFVEFMYILMYLLYSYEKH